MLASCANEQDSRLSSKKSGDEAPSAAKSPKKSAAATEPAAPSAVEDAAATQSVPQAIADKSASPGIGSTSKDYGDYPKPAIGYVTDLGGLMNAGTIHALDSRLRQVEKDTSVEIAVLTVRSVQDYAATGHFSLNSFARGVYDTWGVGNQPKDNGVLLIVSARDKECYVLFGRYFPASCDEAAGKILKEVFLPRFKANDVDGAIKACVEAMALEFAEKKYDATAPAAETVAPEVPKAEEPAAPQPVDTAPAQPAAEPEKKTEEAPAPAAPETAAPEGAKPDEPAAPEDTKPAEPK